MKILLLIISFLIYQNVFAQRINFEKMADSCNVLIDLNKIKEASALCEKMLSFSKKFPNSFENGNTYRIFGNLYLQKYDFENADENYSKAMQIAEKLNNRDCKKLKATTFYNHAAMYSNNGDYETALKMYLNAENLFRELNDLNWLTKTHNRLGSIYICLLKKDKSVYYNQKAYLEALQTGDKYLLALNLISYGNSMFDTGDTLSSIKHYLESIKIAKQINNPKILMTAYYDLGHIYSEMKKFKIAIQYYRESKYYGAVGNLFDQCDILFKIGLVHAYMNNFKPARDTLFIALAMAERIKSKVLQRNILEGLDLIETNTKNFEKAHQYLYRCYDLNDEIMSEQGQQQVNFLDAKYKAAKREADINRLISEKKLQEEKVRKKNIIISSITVLSLFTIFLGMLLMRSYRQKQKLVEQENEIHKHKIKQLESEKMLLATQSVLHGEESERKRLARDLHDGLGGLLSGVKIALNTMKGNVILADESVGVFNHALGLLDGSITELRRVAHNMMPEALVKLGLKNALSDFCLELDKVNPIHILFQFYGEFERVDSNLEINAYRIVQELVNNSIKHSKAKELTVQMIQEKSRLCFMVMDDGIGFDFKNLGITKGIGLASIKSRVDAFQGQLEISSEHDKGCEITVEFLI